LLGAKAVIAESFERIHRSNLVGMGVLPLQFHEGMSRKTLHLTGDETLALTGLSGGITPRMNVQLEVTRPDGTQRMLNVSPMAANITSTKVGDNVVVGVEDTRTFVLSRPGVQTPAPGAGTTAGAVETSRGVAGARISESIASWVVVRVDPAANTITLVNPGGGEVRTYDVTTDAGRQQLPRVKQGDNLTAINSRLVVAAITPKS